MPVQNPGIQPFLKSRYRKSEVTELIQFLTEQGTFRFPTLPNGLFSAAISTDGEFDYTGYSHVWVRDNVHIAHAHLVIGQHETAAHTAQALCQWFEQQRPRFEGIISGSSSSDEVMLRPHIRFQGATLTDSTEKWSHAQNDALGYFLWLYCKLALIDAVPWTPAVLETLTLFPRYFQQIKFWQDEDSGHWEETRKVEASSIGVATAGLRQFRALLMSKPLQTHDGLVSTIESLIEQGQTALSRILPAECSGPQDVARRYDSALLFLIYPTEVVHGELADQIVSEVLVNLQGEYGIRRYLGDSYWCADYKTALAPEARTADFSDDISARDRLLKPGLEAQWCIFDPIVSIHFARRFLDTHATTDLDQQIHFMHRSLAQLTGPGSVFGPYLCPESYYCEKGTYVPNDVTPLLWTQANLRLALHFLAETAED